MQNEGKDEVKRSLEPQQKALQYCSTSSRVEPTNGLEDISWILRQYLLC